MPVTSFSVKHTWVKHTYHVNTHIILLYKYIYIYVCYIYVKWTGKMCRNLLSSAASITVVSGSQVYINEKWSIKVNFVLNANWIFKMFILNPLLSFLLYLSLQKQSITITKNLEVLI